MTAKLKQLEGLDVIEKVNVPTSWINPLVVVEKPNGDIRICLDMRQANRAILMVKHPVPTVEETLQEISEAKVSGKLHLNMAFIQTCGYNISEHALVTYSQALCVIQTLYFIFFSKVQLFITTHVLTY